MVNVINDKITIFYFKRLLTHMHHLKNSLSNCCYLGTVCRENSQLRGITAGGSLKFRIERKLPVGLLEIA